MDRVHLPVLGQPDDAVDIQVGSYRTLAAADFVGLVGLESVQAQAVFMGVDGSRSEA